MVGFIDAVTRSHDRVMLHAFALALAHLLHGVFQQHLESRPHLESRISVPSFPGLEHSINPILPINAPFPRKTKSKHHTSRQSPESSGTCSAAHLQHSRRNPVSVFSREPISAVAPSQPTYGRRQLQNSRGTPISVSSGNPLSAVTREPRHRRRRNRFPLFRPVSLYSDQHGQCPPNPKVYLQLPAGFPPCDSTHQSGRHGTNRW